MKETLELIFLQVLVLALSRVKKATFAHRFTYYAKSVLNYFGCVKVGIFVEMLNI